jgi:hypothetical protein
MTNKRLIQALTDARGALHMTQGIEMEGIRGPGAFTEEDLLDDLEILDEHIESLRRA